jgi:hypothetical protein
MKKSVLFPLPLLLLVAAISRAQQPGSNAAEATPEGTLGTTITFPIERVQTPSAADLYCAGFVGKAVAKDKYVTGGLESPSTTRFANGDAIYLNGKGYEVGQQFTIVRELRDPNRYELFKGQWAALKAAGQPYEELARVKVIDTRSKMAIARIEFSCNAVIAGDFAIPFVEKAATAFHPPLRFDRYAPAGGGATGRILLAKDFDSELGTGGTVYVNLGANQGLKVGDYLRAVRTGGAMLHAQVDSLSARAAAGEPTQSKPAVLDPTMFERNRGSVVHSADMPRRGVGEIVIVGTTPTTATGMIVFSVEPVHLGDLVEVEQH